MIALAIGLSACGDFPELDGVFDDDAPYPSLVPIETLKNRAPDPTVTPETSPQLTSRVDRLRARANGLKRDIIDDETQARMDAGVQ